VLLARVQKCVVSPERNSLWPRRAEGRESLLSQNHRFGRGGKEEVGEEGSRTAESEHTYITIIILLLPSNSFFVDITFVFLVMARDG